MNGSETIKEVGEEGYNFLDNIERVFEEKSVIQSKANGHNKIRAFNRWAVAILRYRATILEGA